MCPAAQRVTPPKPRSADLSLAAGTVDSPRRWGVPHACLTAFALTWLALAVDPFDRTTWLLESLPTLAVLPGIFFIYRRGRLSPRSYVFSTVFLVLHTLGSHYTYSHVPLGDWARDTFGFSRNHYDRAVHFAFGLLLFLPNLELAFGPAKGRRPWVQYYLAFTAIAWWSVFYELLEWLTVRVVDPSAGMAYLGTQGDAWDSQKDMALACIGAALAIGVELWVRSAGNEAAAPNPAAQAAAVPTRPR